MRRTQLNFDEKTYFQLVSYARREKTSISQAARKLISKQLDLDAVAAKNPLLGLAQLGKQLKIKGPTDLSTNLDYYLYGAGNPKFRLGKSSRKLK